MSHAPVRPWTLPEKLARELVRVAVIRTHYEELRRLPNVMVAPQIAMLNASIEAGCRAAGGEGGIEAMVAAVADLGQW